MTDIHPLVQRLYDLAARGDRARLAELRRSIAHPLAAMPIVARSAGQGSRREEDRSAIHGGPRSIRRGSESLARALRRCASDSDSVTLRFRALLDCDPEDLATHLRHAVSLVRSKEMAVDWDDIPPRSSLVGR